MSNEYIVTWSMVIWADDPVDAAKQALGIQRDPQSIATVFRVMGDDGTDTVVDLEEHDAEGIEP